MDVPNSHRKVNRQYLNWATRLSARRAAHIITVSEYTKRAIMTRLAIPAERITVAYNAPAEHFHPRSEQELSAFKRTKGLPERYLLYLGTLEPRKNVPALLKAYAKVRDRLGLPLLIGGDKGWNYDEIFTLHRSLKLHNDVRFLGYVPLDEQPLWYAAALAFVFPARYEGFGMPPLEAMASGTPVITSTATSLPEIVGDAALLVDPDDIDGLAGALCQVVGDQELRDDLRQRGLARAALFHWRQLAEKTLDVYRKVGGLKVK
jgi:glycosyltransferase involved in cell wall biosynthesis